ncbi:magnesium/cobalt transporter CorA, partial [Nitrospinota bacterium]
PNQRPKFEDHGDYLFVVMKFLDFDEETKRLVPEQISLILGKNYILTFQEKIRGKLDPIRNRIRNPKARIRARGIDYTFYSLLDVIVDSYFVVLEKIGEALAELEGRVIENPSPEVLRRIFENKVNMMVFRRATWPLRDMANVMMKGDSPLIDEDLEHFLGDLHDHLMQMVEVSDSTREMAQGLADLYLSVVNNRMNEVVKVLTIIATIFIPLTFIVGVYGMNFKYMPELEWRWGYFAIWGLIGVVGISMCAYFVRKRWM